MADLQEVIGNYNSFLDDVMHEMKDAGIDFGDFSQLDHMCYRTSSLGQYHQKQIELEPFAILLGETSVNGRPISTFKLNEPLIHGRWRIDALELPAPKQGSDYVEGLEHIEFVLFDDFAKFISKYPQLNFDTKSMERGINPELGLKLGKYTVKFHLLSLPTVIYLEHKLGITEVGD